MLSEKQFNQLEQKKFKCPKCHAMTVAWRNSKVYQCIECGHELTNRGLGYCSNSNSLLRFEFRGIHCSLVDTTKGEVQSGSCRN